MIIHHVSRMIGYFTFFTNLTPKRNSKLFIVFVLDQCQLLTLSNQMDLGFFY